MEIIIRHHSRVFLTSKSSRKIFELMLCEETSLVLESSFQMYRESIRKSTEIEELLRNVSECVALITGFSRVMIYQFDRDYNSYIAQEYVQNGSLQKYKGLWFPSSDIPSQVRAIYDKNPIRQIADACSEPVGIFPRNSAVDLTLSHLRGVSKWHLKYLDNIGVKSSFSVALHLDDRMYGLISGHNEFKAKPLSLLMMHSLKIIGDITCLQLMLLMQHLENEKNLKMETLLSRSQTIHEVWSPEIASQILNILNCDSMYLFTTLSDRQLVQNFGTVYTEKWVLKAIHSIEELSTLNLVNMGSSLFESDDLFEVAIKEHQDSFDIPAGIIYFRCPPYEFLFFRKEHIQEISWGDVGVLPKFPTQKPDMFLTPENSFSIFKETRRGKSRPWARNEILTARNARLRLLQLVNLELFAKERDAAMKTAAHKSTFLAHMSHELRTPFNGIIGMLDVLRNSPLNDEQKEIVAVSCQAAEHMLHLLDDVLLVSRLNAGK
jgi:light-regulated signal transduction histidine kinase (bacteriophytochrome)